MRGIRLAVACGVLLMLFSASSPAVLAVHDRQVNSSADDADERGNGTFSSIRITADIYANTNTGINNYRSAGFRFENIPIDQGEQIENAYIELYILNNDDMNAIIYAHDVDNSVDFSANANIIDNAQRPKTTAHLVWAENSLGTNSWENSDNFASILQEIVDRPGWERGNAITILFIAENDQILTANTRTYDFNPALAAKLHFHYQPTIGDTDYPVRALPRSVIYIRQYLVSNGQEATDITAKIAFSNGGLSCDNTYFTFLSTYLENDISIDNCPADGTVYAEWYVSPPAIEENYSFFVEWEFIHDDYHYDVSDNFALEVSYFRNPTPHTILVFPLSNDGLALSIVAIGIGVSALVLGLHRRESRRGEPI